MSKPSLVRRLTSRGADLRIHPLLEAVSNQDTKNFNSLLDKRKDLLQGVLAVNERGKTCLMLAVEFGRKDFVTKLLELYHEHGEEVDINCKDKQGYTAFHMACMDGNLEIILLLLEEKRLDVNAVNEDQATPLHFFCKNFANPNLGDVWEAFIRRKPLINARNSGGETPLHKAIFNSALRGMLVEALLEAGADVNAVTYKNESVLMFAIRMNRFPLVKQLAQHGANTTNKAGRDNLTPIQLAEQEDQREVIKFLQEVQDLSAWLRSLDLEQYLPNFLKHEVFLDLADQIDAGLMDSLEIKQAGARLKLAKAAKELAAKKQHSKSSSFDSMKESPLSASQKMERKRHKDDADYTKLQEELRELLTKDGKEWLIDPGELEFGSRLGAGASAKVVEGVYRKTRVALKIFKSISDSQVDEFKKEMEVLSSVESLYLVAWYGAALAHGRLTVVMELCRRGSLYDVLNHGPSHQFRWKRCFSWLHHMSSGLDALHSAQIVHRDFKSLNVLVTEDWKLKVADFGLSRFTNQDKQLETLGKLRGTYAYCAPEVGDTSYTPASDVYSLGIVLWELAQRLLTGAYAAPYSEYGVQFDFQTMMAAKEGKRPTLPQNAPEELAKLYAKMVQHIPAQRCSIAKILSTLKRLRQFYTANRATWDALLPSATPDPPDTDH